MLGKDKKGSCNLSRVDSTTCLFPVEEKAVEYYFASDARWASSIGSKRIFSKISHAVVNEEVILYKFSHVLLENFLFFRITRDHTKGLVQATDLYSQL